MAQLTLDNIERDEALALLGNGDAHLRLLREALGVKVVARGETISLHGTEEQVDLARKIFDQMRSRYKRTRHLSVDDLRFYLSSAVYAEGASGSNRKPAAREIVGPMRRLWARTAGQSQFIEAMREHDLTFCIGPAGTGKSFLAVAAALEALHQGQIKRIILARPAVEAGEKLGFLPGDMEAKVHPYLRPLLDALRDMLDFHQVRSYLDNEVVEVVPLAFMRGRTLNESFVILDEAQNSTIPQMKMFLTRLGNESKAVVTGDVTQVDLPMGTTNGLSDAVHRLGTLDGVALVRMDKGDIVRHPLVQAIVNAYELTEGDSEGSESPGPEPQGQ
ncbi:PhoH-like protein [Planctomycetes bacterium Pan216]|uniref:PhoH-like protein n=1 Tax=Kolteria novifilia TaxID=2527975 RepID=A0A518B890_9BACT|nr:PhoH-like protein [Planctomycetes bacterium Pan216]